MRTQDQRPHRPRRSSSLDRRDFLRVSAAASTAAFLPRAAEAARRRVVTEDRKIRIGVVGCGGKGYSDMMACAGEEIVALADVDRKAGKPGFDAMPDAAHYHDFRDMLDREELDAVIVSTPDHSHAPAALMAMERGLHVYCQKPLTHTVEEARLMTLAARRNGVVTQMGNQGTAMPGFRQAVEVIRSGAIGAVREVHVWTNRPVWPQGIQRPAEIQPIPETMRWDLFLGPAPYRPYNGSYAPFNWRGWWDYGTGALGDMACHIMNLPYFALELGAPTEVWAESVEGLNDETAPNRSIVRYRFPPRGERPSVELTWYDGGLKPPADHLPDGFKMANGGSMMVGDDGVMYSGDDYGRVFSLFPEEKFQGHEPPAASLPRVTPPKDFEGKQGTYISHEWLDAIRGRGETSSGFDYAGPFTEAVLLGNVAVRLGARLRWSPATLHASGAEGAGRLIAKDYSRGFELPYRFADFV